MNKKITINFEFPPECLGALKKICEYIRPGLLNQFFDENKLKQNYYDCYIALGALLDSIEENAYKINKKESMKIITYKNELELLEEFCYFINKESMKITLYENELKALKEFCYCINTDDIETLFYFESYREIENCYNALKVIYNS